MDHEKEFRRFKWMLYALLVFLISAYFAYGELKYALRGKTVDATVTGIRETTSGGRHPTPMLSVEYRFTEASGNVRTERDKVDVDWPLPDTGSIRVQYLPGVEDGSRLSGHSSMVWVYVFLACSAVLGFFIIKLWREASDKTYSFRPTPYLRQSRR